MSFVLIGCGSHRRCCQAESTLAYFKSRTCCITQLSGAAVSETAISRNSQINKNRCCIDYRWHSLVDTVWVHLLGQLFTSCHMHSLCLDYWMPVW